MRYLSLAEVTALHDQVLADSGGASGIRDLGAAESALAQPRQTFGGEDLYPSLEEKTAAIGFSLIQNHPFVDGNKRTGHAAMETFLLLNGHEITASIDDAERMILDVASGRASRADLLAWVQAHVSVAKR